MDPNSLSHPDTRMNKKCGIFFLKRTSLEQELNLFEQEWINLQG